MDEHRDDRSLHSLGWSPFFAQHFQDHERRGLVPARVIRESREIYRLATAAGETWGELAGALRYRAQSREELPAVGDWVACLLPGGGDSGVVVALLPRASRLARRAPGRAAEMQLLAANVDTAFLLTSLNRDFSPRRLERYLGVAREGGVEAVVVLSKVDLVADLAPFIAAAREAFGDVPIAVVSAVTGEGLGDLGAWLRPGRTVALLGSSGVGKSTLLNRLAGGALQAVRVIRAADDRGRHATTRRQLFALPGGALVLDTPGLRELGLWGEEGTAEAGFDDLAGLAAGCRFRDCRHRGEPGCAVGAAVAEGRLSPGRLESFHKLRREERYLADRLEKGANWAEKKKWRTLMRELDR